MATSFLNILKKEREFPFQIQKKEEQTFQKKCIVKYITSKKKRDITIKEKSALFFVDFFRDKNKKVEEKIKKIEGESVNIFYFVVSTCFIF